MQGRHAVPGPGARVADWREEGRAEAEAGQLGLPGPGETESQRRRLPRYHVAPGTDGGAAAGSPAEGGVTRSPPGLEGGSRGPKTSPGGGSALQLIQPCPSFSVFRLSRTSLPAPRWPRPSRAGRAAEGQGAPAPRGDRAAFWGRGASVGSRAAGAGRGSRGGRLRASARPLPPSLPQLVPPAPLQPPGPVLSAVWVAPQTERGGGGVSSQAPRSQPRAQSSDLQESRCGG